jgi:hypothetical protein
MTSEQLLLWKGEGQGKRQSSLVAQERAALVTGRLVARGRVSLDEVRQMTGLTYSGVWYLMSKIARVCACWYDREERAWKMVEGETADGSR